MNERQSARASSLVTQRNCPSRMDRDAHTQRERVCVSCSRAKERMKNERYFYVFARVRSKDL